jgi:cbb3-type cytochrome oxidase maturation protein
MSVIVILLIASISVASIFLIAFIWNVKNGQFDDDYSPPRRILFDDNNTELHRVNIARKGTRAQSSRKDYGKK